MIAECATAGIDVGRMLVTPASNVYDHLKAYAAGGSDRSLRTPNVELEDGAKSQRSAKLAKIEVLEQKLSTLTQAQKEYRKLLTIGLVALAVLIWLSR